MSNAFAYLAVLEARWYGAHYGRYGRYGRTSTWNICTVHDCPIM
jgi:hypothetical protein